MGRNRVLLRSLGEKIKNLRKRENLTQEEFAVNLNIIVKAGAWFSYNDAKIGQGRENAKIYLSQHPDIMAEVENKVRAHYNLPLKEVEPAAPAESEDDAE